MDNGTTGIQDIGGFRLTASPRPGREEFSVFRAPYFIKAILLISCYGLTLGIMMYLFWTGKISVEIKDLYSVGIYIFLLAGGLHIVGELDMKRFALILLCVVVEETYDTLSNNYVADVFSFFVKSWPILWWLWREPEMMARLGLRKDRLARDALAALLLTAVLMVYVITLFSAYGFDFRMDPGYVIAHASCLLPENIIIFCFIFAVWNRLNDRGVSQVNMILMFLLLILPMQFPVFFASYLSGTVKPGLCLCSLLANTLLFVLLMSVTFNRFRNSLPATFMFSAIIEILVVIGIL